MQNLENVAGSTPPAPGGAWVALGSAWVECAWVLEITFPQLGADPKPLSNGWGQASFRTQREVSRSFPPPQLQHYNLRNHILRDCYCHGKRQTITPAISPCLASKKFSPPSPPKVPQCLGKRSILENRKARVFKFTLHCLWIVKGQREYKR